MADWDGAGYERISGLQRRLARDALDGLEFRPDERVLDVGCGDGYLTRVIASRLPGGSVVGVDASPRMIEVARSRPDPSGADVRFLVADARDLPFTDEFDTVVSFNALHWVADRSAEPGGPPVIAAGPRVDDPATQEPDRSARAQVVALTAIARSLRPDGRVVVQQVCAGPRRSLEQTAMRACAEPRWAAAFTGFAAPFVHVDPAGYPTLAARAGLRVTSRRVADLSWDFGSRASFTDWCTIGFADWTARLPPAQVAGWVDDVVDAYQAEVGEPGLFRFLQMRAELIRLR